jgi:tetratricopeptide (TPR) repeat protein
MLDYQFFKNWAGGYHIVNVLFHIINTLVLFYVLMRMTGAVWPSAFVAAAFALHPMHVESVAWIAERKDVLSTLFLLLTLAAYVSYVRCRGLVRYVLTVLLFASGLLAKPMLVTLPFLLLLLDYWPLNRFDSQPAKIFGCQSPKITHSHDINAALYRIIIEKIPFFVLSAVSSVITFLTQKAGDGVVDATIIPLKARVGNVFFSYAAYMGKMFWPKNLAVYYPFEAVGAISFWRFVLYALLLFGVTFLVVRFGRSRKYLLVGWFWFVGTLIPVIGLVRFTGSSYADRFTYIPYIGLFVMIAWSAKEFVPKQRYKILTLSAAVVLTALAVTAFCQAGYWKNGLALFEHTLAVTKNNHIISTNYIACLNEAGRFDEAIEQSDELLKIKSDSAPAQSNFGVALLCTGRAQEAIERFRLAIKYDPNYLPAYFNLAVALQNQGRLEEAVSCYKQSLKIKPDNVNCRLKLVAVLGEIGKLDEAVNESRKCLQASPGDPNVLNTFGAMLGRQGKFDEAADYFNRAIQIDPDYTEARNNLNLALAKKQKSREKTKENTEK